MKVEHPRPKVSIRQLLAKVHRDEQGAVSIETILIIAAIALPILIFIYKVAWPRIQNWWHTRMDELEGSSAVPGG